MSSCFGASRRPADKAVRNSPAVAAPGSAALRLSGRRLGCRRRRHPGARRHQQRKDGCQHTSAHGSHRLFALDATDPEPASVL